MQYTFKPAWLVGLPQNMLFEIVLHAVAHTATTTVTVTITIICSSTVKAPNQWGLISKEGSDNYIRKACSAFFYIPC